MSLTYVVEQCILHVAPEAPELVHTAAQVFSEELEKRTGKLAEEHETTASGIWMGTEAMLPPQIMQHVAGLDLPGAEGYRLCIWAENGHACAVVAGADARGVYYGMGRLLRMLIWKYGEARLPMNAALSSTPRYAIRGHQLGYRPKTNAYDAWTPEIYDQYLRELALFGANSVELLPPHTDDDLTGPLMSVDPLEMIGILSEKAHHYGMDVWVWYPNMAENYNDPETIRLELAERKEVFEKMPWLDHLFIPGGDPGELDPEPLFHWVKQVTSLLHESHPKAGVWLSPQTFNPSRGWTDAFYRELDKEPDWLTGVVFGPWEKDPADVLRRQTPSKYPIRNYPDIGHSFRCQFPVEKWDLALALTLGRECINPRPRDEKRIHNTYQASFCGSITYSEGINDDVNKFIWADQEWDPDTDVAQTLRDYARLFIDASQADDLMHGFFSLEENFRGPLLANENVETCLRQWEMMESRLCAFGRDNYRFEMGLLRAYYDAYQKERLIWETHLQNQALHALRRCRTNGVAKAIDEALMIFNQASAQPVCPTYRQRIQELADSLFQHIGMQLTETHHGALHWGRGGFVECMDIPLNDARYWQYVLPPIKDAHKPNEILASANPSAPGDKAGILFDSEESYRISLLEALLDRTNPGPGGFYDNMGSWSSWTRIQNPTDYPSDPGFLRGALSSFVMQTPHAAYDAYHMPLAWQWNGCAMYMTPLIVRYEGLDIEAEYLLRVTYLGYFGQHVKLSAANGDCMIHDYIATDRKIMTTDFVLPKASYADGSLELRFTALDGERGVSVAEIWILKQPVRL